MAAALLLLRKSMEDLESIRVTTGAWGESSVMLFNLFSSEQPEIPGNCRKTACCYQPFRRRRISHRPEEAGSKEPRENNVNG